MRTAIILTAMLFVASSSFARGKGKGRGEGRGDHFKAAMEELQLTKEQKPKIQALHKQKQAQMQSQRTAIEAAHTAFQKAMESNKSSIDTLRDLHNKLIAAKTEKMKAQFEHMMAMRKILTPEQISKFHELRQKHGARRGGRGGGHHRGPHRGPPENGMDD